MPTKGYSNLTVKREVREKLDKLRKELGFATLNDLLVFLVKTYESYTTIGSKLNKLYTSIGSISQRLDILVEVVKHTTTTSKHTTSTSKSTTTGSIRKERKTMLDIIHERKIQLLSEIKPRDSTRFVTKAQSYGIVVIEGAKDTALVEPEFYEEFKNILKEINTMNEEKIRKQLDDKMFKLFTFLRENGLIYFDATDNTWKFI